MMSYEQARDRQHSLMVRRDAIESCRPDLARQITIPARSWDHEILESGAIEIGDTLTSTGGRRVTMINPTQRASVRNLYHREAGAYVFQFGAYGCTYLHVYAASFDEGLEECAAWLAEHAPGHIMTDGSPEHLELCEEACEEAGLAWPVPTDHDVDMDPYYAAFESAESDLTRTESGFLTSHEWWGNRLPDTSGETLHAYVWGLR